MLAVHSPRLIKPPQNPFRLPEVPLHVRLHLHLANQVVVFCARIFSLARSLTMESLHSASGRVVGVCSTAGHAIVTVEGVGVYKYGVSDR